MWKRYDQFDEQDRRSIRNWTLGGFAFYGAVFLVYLAAVATYQSVGGKNRTHAEIMSSASGAAINSDRRTASAAIIGSDVGRAHRAP